MARVALGGYRGPRLGLDGTLTPPVAVPVIGSAPVTDVLAGAVVTVRRRLRTGFDDDGNPEFAWSTAVRGEVLGAETKRELDPVAGTAVWSAKVTVLYSGPDFQDATAEVVDATGLHWAVTRVQQLPDRLVLWLTRLDTAPTVEEESPG